MVWTIEYADTAERALRKIDQSVARRIVDYLEKRLAAREDPRELGKALTGPMGGLWQYRIGDDRVIADVQDQTVTILVLRVGHRSTVYR